MTSVHTPNNDKTSVLLLVDQTPFFQNFLTWWQENDLSTTDQLVYSLFQQKRQTLSGSRKRKSEYDTHKDWVALPHKAKIPYYNMAYNIDRKRNKTKRVCNKENSIHPKWFIQDVELDMATCHDLTIAESQGQSFFRVNEENKEPLTESKHGIISSPFHTKYHVLNESGDRKRVRKKKTVNCFYYDPTLTQTRICVSTGVRESLQCERSGTISPRTKRIKNIWGESHIPDYWEYEHDQEMYRILQKPISLQSNEAWVVSCLFHLSCSPQEYKILEIKRIQNINLWEAFQSHVQLSKRKDVSLLNTELSAGEPGQVQWLFHGTREASLSSICSHGFNRNFSGRNGTKLGLGSYFARDAEISAQDEYSEPTPESKHKFVLLCQVMTGLVSVGRDGSRSPPHIHPDSLELHDSTVQDLANPTIYATFNDSQVYPAFILEFVSS